MVDPHRSSDPDDYTFWLPADLFTEELQPNTNCQVASSTEEPTFSWEARSHRNTHLAWHLNPPVPQVEAPAQQIGLVGREDSQEGVVDSVLGTPACPSVGSRGHAAGQCRPCNFSNRKIDGCRHAAACRFCHLCSPRMRKVAQKERRKAKRAWSKEEEAWSHWFGLDRAVPRGAEESYGGVDAAGGVHWWS
mmetsp:Transcript_74891/g.236672  ORF Transcript_74891/g.236672 Transcript_74891/m.236672 type:complete len:191 (-) Transcript_74891:79-651(-)